MQFPPLFLLHFYFYFFFVFYATLCGVFKDGTLTQKGEIKRSVTAEIG